VGAEIPPGTYVNSDPANCSWERLSNFRGMGLQSNDLIEYQIAAQVTIHAGDAGFHSDCNGVWTKIG
jgi:hypothetical protein